MIEKQRDNYIDIAKALSIVLIVRIHTEVFGEIKAPYPIIIVPLFFFMSGFYDRSEKNIKDYISKACKSLLFPTCIWLLIAFVYGSILHLIDDGEIPFSIDLMYPKLSNPPLWFLIALFYAKMFTWMLVRMKFPSIVLFVFSLLCGWVGCYFKMPFMLSAGLCAFPLYYLGKVLYKYLNMLVEKWYMIVIGIMSLCYMYIQNFPLEIVTLKAKNWIPYYPIAFAMVVISFFPVLAFCKYLSYFKCSILVEYGKRTLGILVTHSLLLHTSFVILNRLFERGGVVWIVCGFIVYIVVCILTYIITLFMERKFPILLGRI